MSKIPPTAAWIAFTPMALNHQMNRTAGGVVVDTEARANLYLNLEPGRRLAEARPVAPDADADPLLQVYREALRLIALDGLRADAVISAFSVIEGFSDGIADGRYRHPHRLSHG